jgi:hypothetical protein
VVSVPAAMLVSLEARLDGLQDQVMAVMPCLAGAYL